MEQYTQRQLIICKSRVQQLEEEVGKLKQTIALLEDDTEYDRQWLRDAAHCQICNKPNVDHCPKHGYVIRWLREWVSKL